MTSPLEEQILSLFGTKAAAISVAGGYQTDMDSDRVLRAVGEREFDDTDEEQVPAICYRRGEKVDRWHLRGAIELILKIDVKVVAATYAEAAALLGDVVKLVEANPLWNNGSSNLAARTWVENVDLPDFEAESNLHFGQLTLCIKAYADATAPGTAKAI
jgi:hypothetical protein